VATDLDGVATLALVATSVNPHARLAHQLACFRRWQALGLTIRSFNTAAERDLLLQAGLGADEVELLDDNESLLPLTGRSHPRLLPILTRLWQTSAARVLLVNADIYPAVSRNPLPLMATCGEISGFTRSDCLSVDDPPSAPRSSYFGGLDIFCLSRDALSRVLETAEPHRSAAGMAFGVPGWDLYMGHLTLSLGGRLVEARFLLHPQHPAGYDSIEPFAPLAELMLASERYRANNHVSLAAEFVKLIERQCLRHVATARMLDMALAQPRTRNDGGSGSEAPTPDQQPAPAEPLRRVAATLARGYTMGDLSPHLLRPNWHLLHLAFQRLQDHATPLAAYLVALQCAIHLQRQAGRMPWRTDYPPNSAHGQELQSVLDEPEAGARTHRLLELLATDLYEHRILNLRLLKFLALQCRDDLETQLFDELLASLRGETHDALALAP